MRAKVMMGFWAGVAAVGLFACGDLDDERAGDEVLVGVDAPAETDDDVAPDPFAPDEEKIRNGTVTSERPEVGSIGGCTATLIARDLAITAAHCVSYRTVTRLGRHLTFRLDAAGGAHRVTVNRYRSFSNQLGAGDVALLGLDSPVPENVATPSPIASRNPSNGTSVTVFGYGCTVIGRNSDGRKRKATFRFGDASAHLCPGDSGGPVYDDSTGAIFGINSGYRLDARRTDIYGNVPTVYAALKSQADQWTAFGLPGAGDAPPGGAPPGGGGGIQPGPELLTCAQTLECRRGGCNLQGNECLQGCLDRSAPSAVAIWRGVYDCASAAGCQNFSCTESRCGAQLQACYQDPGPPRENNPPPGEQPREPQPNPAPAPQGPTCGEDMRVFARWTCTADARHRHRCRDGEAPVWEQCAYGCFRPAPNVDAECRAAQPPAGIQPHADHGPCSDLYRPYNAWTCASDSSTLLRCEAGRLQTHRCQTGCAANPQGPDACR